MSTVVYMVFHQPADSWSGTAQFPIAAFSEENLAEAFALEQPGYGLGVDWFVRSVPLDPEVKK